MPVYNQVQLYQTAQIFTNMNKLCRTPLVGPPQYPLAACNWLHSQLILLRFRVKNSLLIYNKFQHRTSVLLWLQRLFFTSEIKILQLRNLPASGKVWVLHIYVFGIGSSYTYFWHYLLQFSSVLSTVWVHSSSVWVRFFSHHYFWGRPGWFLATALISLVTLTFDPLSSKLGHCRVLPIVSLLCPSVFDLSQAQDRQTDSGHQCIMPRPYGGGSITNFKMFWPERNFAYHMVLVNCCISHLKCILHSRMQTSSLGLQKPNAVDTAIWHGTRTTSNKAYTYTNKSVFKHPT